MKPNILILVIILLPFYGVSQVKADTTQSAPWKEWIALPADSTMFLTKSINFHSFDWEQYEIDWSKIKTFSQLKEVLKGLNIILTNPKPEVKKYLKKIR